MTFVVMETTGVLSDIVMPVDGMPNSRALQLRPLKTM